ncbi:MAG: helix-turn-helix transcriptional regulator [Phycisphaerae bacterium]|nr:helix-turn-helix transcriptional regulator [Phycisphaerae bacterium]
MTTQRQTVAEHLRKLIAQAERRGTSRNAIAVAAGVSARHLQSIAEGDVTPRIDTAQRIAEAIGHRLQLVRA